MQAQIPLNNRKQSGADHDIDVAVRPLLTDSQASIRERQLSADSVEKGDQGFYGSKVRA